MRWHPPICLLVINQKNKKKFEHKVVLTSLCNNNKATVIPPRYYYSTAQLYDLLQGTLTEAPTRDSYESDVMTVTSSKGRFLSTEINRFRFEYMFDGSYDSSTITYGGDAGNEELHAFFMSADVAATVGAPGGPTTSAASGDQDQPQTLTIDFKTDYEPFVDYMRIYPSAEPAPQGKSFFILKGTSTSPLFPFLLFLSFPFCSLFAISVPFHSARIRSERIQSDSSFGFRGL